MDLLFTKLVFTLRLDDTVSDPSAFFLLKKGFRKAFRETVCCSDGTCEQCRYVDPCSYNSTFSQNLADDLAAVKRHQKPSLPFVFTIPSLAGQVREGQEVELGLVLIGTAMQHVREYCAAVLRLFGPTTFEGVPPATVLRIESVGCSGFRNLLMEGDDEIATSALATISADDLDALSTLSPGRIGLRIITPLRIHQESVPVRKFSFSPFIRCLLRRISSLAYYYCGSLLDLDYKHLARQASEIELEENEFSWSEVRKGRTEGITGSGVLIGPLADFHQILLLGEYFHCGKGATYGAGQYELLG